MVESFSAFPIVELARSPADTDGRPCCHTQHAARSWTAAFQPTQVAVDAAGIHWYEYESSVERQLSKSGKGCQVCAGADEEFGGEPRSESDRRLDHSGVSECLGDADRPSFIVDEISNGTVDSGGAELHAGGVVGYTNLAHLPT